MRNFFFRSAKINEFRLWGLIFTMVGMGVMILGTSGFVFWGKNNVTLTLAGIFMVIGMITLLVSVAIYFWAGMLSTSAKIIICPECGRQTKMLGVTDRCMFCKTMLTHDPGLATEQLPEEADGTEIAGDTAHAETPNNPVRQANESSTEQHKQT